MESIAKDVIVAKETEVFVPDTHKVYLEVDLPPDFPEGDAIVTMVFKYKGKHVNRMGEVMGLGAGEVWMAENFDEPLEDFSEYK